MKKIKEKELIDSLIEATNRTNLQCLNPLSFIANRSHNYIYATKNGIVKLTPHKDEAIMAICFKNLLHPMLPKIDHVYQFHPQYYGIWREDLVDINISCCDLKNMWLCLIRSECETMDCLKKVIDKKYISCYHFEIMSKFYLFLLNNEIIIGDLGLTNWGHRKGQENILVVRDFGGIERYPEFIQEIKYLN